MLIAGAYYTGRSQTRERMVFREVYGEVVRTIVYAGRAYVLENVVVGVVIEVVPPESQVFSG